MWHFNYKIGSFSPTKIEKKQVKTSLNTNKQFKKYKFVDSSTLHRFTFHIRDEKLHCTFSTKVDYLQPKLNSLKKSHAMIYNLIKSSVSYLYDFKEHYTIWKFII